MRTSHAFTERPSARAAASTGAELLTVHAAGGRAMLEAAVGGAREGGRTKVLAVTVLTSLDQKDLESLGFQCNVEDLVLSRAKAALETGCDGIISSGLEASRIRQSLGDKLLIISPGIRPVINKPADDQKRTVDVAQAFANGADYIVVGRPIRQAPDPRAKAEEIQQRIAALFAKTQ